MAGDQSERRIKTLVVEDSAPVRRAICLFLGRQSGIEIVGTAKDGQDALEQVKALQPDLVLTDWQMPEIDGLALIQQLRKQYPNIKIIFITVHDSPEVQVASTRNGADAFVPTGRLYEDLLHEIRRIFPGLYVR